MVSQKFNPKNIKNLLIVVAMEIEEKALLQGIPYRTQSISTSLGIQVKEYDIGKCCVRIATSGVGPVNGAITLAFASERFALDAVMLLGVGGALDPDLIPGDLVIANKVLQHDSLISMEDKTEWMAPGELFLSKKPDERLKPEIETNSRLQQWILESCISERFKLGAVLSGSEFAGSYKRKLEIAALDKDALLVDMEAAGIAQIARRLGIPFVVAKTVADRLNPTTSISSDYKMFLESASHHAGNVLNLLLKTFGNK